MEGRDELGSRDDPWPSRRSGGARRAREQNRCNRPSHPARAINAGLVFPDSFRLSGYHIGLTLSQGRLVNFREKFKPVVYKQVAVPMKGQHSVLGSENRQSTIGKLDTRGPAIPKPSPV